MGCGWFAMYVLLCQEEYKSEMEFTFDYNRDWVSGQDQIVCLCGSDNCDGYIEKINSVEKNSGSE
jgi:hypothetical protein